MKLEIIEFCIHDRQSLQPGDLVDIPEAAAQFLIDAGAAKPVKPAKGDNA